MPKNLDRNQSKIVRYEVRFSVRWERRQDACLPSIFLLASSGGKPCPALILAGSQVHSEKVRKKGKRLVITTLREQLKFRDAGITTRLVMGKATSFPDQPPNSSCLPTMRFAWSPLGGFAKRRGEWLFLSQTFSRVCKPN